MSHARRGFAGTIVLVGLAVLFALLWLLHDALEPAAPPAVQPVARAAPVRQAYVPLAPVLGALAQVQAQAAPPELHGNDTADPCTAGFERAIPADYETVTAESITLAWSPGETRPGPSDPPFQPTAVAYLVTGLLEEAAQLTGTPRRERLTVIVDPSLAVFRARTRAPAWAHAVYDGGAVRLPVEPSAELGVQISSLRHELMHAQLHAAVGCMPAWFNEGVAMYFAGRPPMHAWVRMLRSADAGEPAIVQGSTFADLTAERADRAYGLSLAMVGYLVDRAGELGVRTTVQLLQATTRQTQRPVTDLWDRLYPDVGSRAVMDALTRKVFGLAPGPELDAIFRTAVCCHGARTLAGFRCHGAPVVPGKTMWIDEASRDLCYERW